MSDITGSFQLGPDSGRVLIRTSRAGLAAKAGHDLVLEMTRWAARVEIPPAESGGLTAATVSAELDLSSLTVREGTGGARPLTDSDRRDIAKTMRAILGDGTASFGSSRIIQSGSGGAIEGTLTLRDRSQPARLQLTQPRPGTYRGTATVTQSAFGVKPYSGFFGALKLRDEVQVEVEADLNRAAATLSRPRRVAATSLAGGFTRQEGHILAPADHPAASGKPSRPGRAQELHGQVGGRGELARGGA